MRRFVFATLLLLLTIAGISRAQGEPFWILDFEEGDNLTYDETGSPFPGVTVDTGVLYGVGPTFNSTFGNYDYWAQIRVYMPCDTWTSATVRFWISTMSGAHFRASEAFDEFGAPLDDWNIQYLNAPMNEWVEDSITLPAGTASFDVVIAGSNLTSDSELYTAIDWVKVDADPECEPVTALTRPLAAVDEYAGNGIFDMNYISGLNGSYEGGVEVRAVSENSHANVTAVASGTVVQVTPFTTDDCPLFMPVFTAGSLHLCALVIPGPLTANAFNNIYSLEMVTNYYVVVQDGTDANVTYQYILSNPRVEVGDEVTAGCILGETITLKQWPLAGLGISFPLPFIPISLTGNLLFQSPETNAGVAFVTMYNESVAQSLFPILTQQPSQADCKASALSACLNKNSSLVNFEYWTHESDVTLLEGGGVTLPAFTYIFQADILIDPEADYILSVQARYRSAGGDEDIATMNLQIGGQVASYSIGADWHNYTLTTSGTEWYFEDLTTKIFISNQNTSTASLEIKYACLAPVTATTAPGSCYFANNEFDADGAGWTVSGVTFASGQAYMIEGSTLFQTVLLKPDDEVTPHTYKIRAVVRLLTTGDYTGQIGKEVALQYQYPVLESFVDVGVIDSALVESEGLDLLTGNVVYDHAYTLEADLEISEETNSVFTFGVDVTDGDNYLQGLRVDSLCIDPEGDGTYPGQDGGGGYEPPVIIGCSTVPLPLEGSIAAWTYYHWSNLKRFFNCDLMPMLRKWYNLFQNFQLTVRNIARWWMVLMHRGSSWLSTVFYWLNGHFANIAQGRVTTISEEGGCHDVFCAVIDVISTLANLLNPVVQALSNVVNVLLGVLVGAVNLFFTIITGLIATVLALIIRLFQFLQMAAQLLGAIISAYNTATPTAIPGLPNCAADINSSAICIGVWVADNTIFMGRWGVLWTLLLSVLTIHLIIWAIAEFRDVVLKTWGSS